MASTSDESERGLKVFADYNFAERIHFGRYLNDPKAQREHDDVDFLENYWYNVAET